MTDSAPGRARAEAHANIALAKYWGKSERGDNLTAVPSLSLTLDALTTRSEVCFDASLSADEVNLGGKQLEGRELERVRVMLDRVRLQSGEKRFARVESANNFPTAAGLASSASGFAALAVAARAAAELGPDAAAASKLARQSSASAARSIFEGFVELGRDADAAAPVAPSSHWDLCMLVAIVEQGKKEVSSTGGMEQTRLTSPYYAGWLEAAPPLFDEAREAVLARDFQRLATNMERSTLLMHASMLGSDPPIVYFKPASIALIHAITGRRAQGFPEAFTLDAGPNVKVLTLAEHAEKTENFLRSVPGVAQVLVCRPGPPAALLELGGPLADARRLRVVGETRT